MQQQLLTDDINSVQYGVVVNGKTLFTSSAKFIAENFRNNLPESDKAIAKIINMTNDGKQVLLD